MKVNGIKVKAVWGQISAVQADAYVVPEYPDHVSSTPMINDIIAGGAQYGFDVFKRHLSLGSLNMCSAILSVANGGNSRYLIHSDVLGGPAEKLASNIEDAMSAVMTIARPQKEMITSMAMPLIGFGEFGSLSATAAAIALLSGINNLALLNNFVEISLDLIPKICYNIHIKQRNKCNETRFSRAIKKVISRRIEKSFE